jgi:hypothetical protein
VVVGVASRSLARFANFACRSLVAYGQSRLLSFAGAAVESKPEYYRITNPDRPSHLSHCNARRSASQSVRKTFKHHLLRKCVTYSLLRQLSRPLVLAVSNQLNDSPLIRCKPSDFLDDLTDERGALGEVAFSTGDSWDGGYGCDFLLGLLVLASMGSVRWDCGVLWLGWWRATYVASI